MAITTAQRKEALAAAAEEELDSLVARGVLLAGNAFSPVVLVKGELNDAERSASIALLSGADGEALRSALSAIGWAPEDFCALASVAGAGEAGVAPTVPAGSPLPSPLFREALEALDPEAVILLDDAAADAMREAYVDALALVDDFDCALLKPGLVAHVLGRRVLALDGFEAALADPKEKQRMWAYLKQMPPLSAPY